MSFRLAIQSPTAPVFEGDVTSLVAPGTVGSFGVLTDHAPLISGLGAGDVEVTLTDGSTRVFFITGGFLEVSNNQAMLLADALEPAESLDLDAAERELDTLTTAATAATDEDQLARARARVRSARRVRDAAHGT